MVADFDPVNFEVEWDHPMQSRGLNRKVGSAYRAFEGPGEPGLTSLRLEQTKRDEDRGD